MEFPRVSFTFSKVLPLLPFPLNLCVVRTAPSSLFQGSPNALIRLMRFEIYLLDVISIYNYDNDRYKYEAFFFLRTSNYTLELTLISKDLRSPIYHPRKYISFTQGKIQVESHFFLSSYQFAWSFRKFTLSYKGFLGRSIPSK